MKSSLLSISFFSGLGVLCLAGLLALSFFDVQAKSTDYPGAPDVIVEPIVKADKDKTSTELISDLDNLKKENKKLNVLVSQYASLYDGCKK